MSMAFVIKTASRGQQYAYLPHCVLSSSISGDAITQPVSEFVNNGNNNILRLYISYIFSS